MKPYGYVRKDGEGLFIYGEHQFQNALDAELVPVYTHPKEWVGLTDEEVERLIHNFGPDPWTLLDEVEARLKARNT